MHDFRDTGAMLYRQSCEASLEVGQVWVQFILVIRREWNDVHMTDINHIYELRIEIRSESDPRNYEATKAAALKKAQKKSLFIAVDTCIYGCTETQEGCD